MAISRINYTGRRRIGRKDVGITVHEADGGAATFDADLRLKAYKLPDDALVFIEAYRQTVWMRFPYGRVGALVPPVDRKLGDFDSTDGILFRVRVTSAAGRQGVMLAEADRIPARRPDEVEEERSPLLPVRSAELDQEVYRVDFSNAPVLLIHKSLDKQTLASSLLFRSLIGPAAMREILTRILHIEEYPDLEEHDDWRTRWLLFASSLPGAGDVPGEDDKDSFDDWIETAVSCFARQQRLLDHFGAFWHKEGNR